VSVKGAKVKGIVTVTVTMTECFGVRENVDGIKRVVD
jgi:hypothetical protein